MVVSAKGYQVRIRMTQVMAMTYGECGVCGEPIDVGVVCFVDTSSLSVYHLKTCRRESVKNAAKVEGLLPHDLVFRFGVDRPAAYKIYTEVIHDHGN